MPFDPLARLHITEGDGRTTVCFAAGTVLTEANIEDVGRRLAALVADRDRLHLTLDLGSVTALTSAVLAKFISLNGKVRAAGGRLTLVNPTPTVRQVLRVTRLDTILDVRTSAEPLLA